jgi:glycosyltransferase involved in cell wall biosynthesis
MDGISFMVRVRDEEETIEKSIRSLSLVTVPHEIVIVLHLCTDRTEEIVKSINNPNIRILHYNEEISRAGYACLATDTSSKHSLMTYYNWCKDQTRYSWIFKWDADMVARSDLVDFINSNTWEKRNINYVIGCNNSTSVSTEPYLMGSLMYYSKHLFWEVPVYTCGSETKVLGTWLEHCSELTNLKSYWTIKPWYETEDSEEANIVKSRIQTLTREIGPEKPGMARCLCPDANEPYSKIMDRELENINKFC